MSRAPVCVRPVRDVYDVIFTLIRFCSRFPVSWVDNREADLTLIVNIRMIYGGDECDRWRLEGVLRGEVNLYFKTAFVIRR